MSTDTDTPRALDRLRANGAPARIGQATAVEQSRAIAEVQAQVIVAQQMPRDVDRAIRDMQRSCAQKSLADRAFYRYKRGGSQISGESIVLAKELARCWGNIQYGIAELRRDDGAGESEMMAFAWDVQTNARASTTFIVPHVRDTTNGRKALADVRDIYENNANMGSRRQREMIFAVLPGWYVEDAKSACYATLATDKADGETLAERAAAAVKRFAEMGIRTEHLVQKVGAPQDKWSAADLAQLTVIYRSLQRGESTRDDEFGAAPDRITAGDLATTDASPAQAAPPSAEPPKPPHTAGAGEAPAPPPPPPAKLTSGQKTQLDKERQRLGYDDSEQDWEQWLADLARLAKIAAIASPAELTQPEAKDILWRLKPLEDAKVLRRLLDTGEAVPGE